MRKAWLALVAFGVLATTGVTACTDNGDDGGSTGAPRARSGASEKVGVIMPDSTSSQRWTQDDPKFLKQAFDAAGVPVDIQNADGDRAKFQEIARTMIQDGAKVLIIVNLDSDSARTVLSWARGAGVKTIDYDRLSLNGGADYYVSFDGHEVGVQQGEGLKRCLSDKGYDDPVVAELNGSPTDNNATLFKGGYDEVLQPMYDSAQYTKGPDQFVPDWGNEAGAALFAQMIEQQPKIRGVLAANDGLANAVIGVLKKHSLNGKVPVTGQDATVEGLQNILAGDQCMTVYKAIKPEAQAAAALAISLFKGQDVSVPLDRQKDPESGAYVPFVKLQPVAIDKTNIGDVIADGFVTRTAVCTQKYLQACKKAGLYKK
ncbi:sugar ABC transporter substrate-binding protein [Mangrovihabitans endophyticus]|uniref:Sugar ABC transporter substrate-binding protein n=1 Tax=Mangrovihabitans endophyticus TaxID=1751298 RepID=A0A8J3FSU7_9ACTN|nr:substrate-binding domain-containing protein [Mangrovihabitans endophyticus]GGL16818.1 sugar ABC transporter substrate-binding protein [Mangrovihabitans endophyticus]